jgi:hypothetical protein
MDTILADTTGRFKTTSPDAYSNVSRVLEVPGVVRIVHPAGLAGGLACASAGGRRAKDLTVSVAMIRIEKHPARHALALSRFGHSHPPTRPSGATITATAQPLERSLKKKESEAEEDRQRR